jgi:membrane fusion protein (multidrug efflux system)
MTIRQTRFSSSIVVATVLATGAVLALWKYSNVKEAQAASATAFEPMEMVTTAVATERSHQESTTAVGTVLALRSITLRNEVPGTVHSVNLTPGQIVEMGSVLVALDVSVEEAELKAQEAQAALAQTQLDRVQRLIDERAAPQTELDRAKAERDVAVAQIARNKAIIARKIIRAPFRARIGISDVHTGQYLEGGTQLTTLQGVSEEADIDFAVAQRVASALRNGQHISAFVGEDPTPISATIVAVDARVDEATRNAMVRARVAHAPRTLVPGAAVRVQVPFGAELKAVAVPASALRKGPSGDHVFVIAQDSTGKQRAHVRNVQSGALIGDSVLIVGGLKAGEQVAASGSFKLRDAVLVAPADNKTTR